MAGSSDGSSAAGERSGIDVCERCGGSLLIDNGMTRCMQCGTTYGAAPVAIGQRESGLRRWVREFLAWRE